MKRSRGAAGEPLFHNPYPDYSGPVPSLPEETGKRIKEKLEALYGEDHARDCFREIERIMRVYRAHKTPEMIEWEKGFDPAERFTERDAVLITYGDMIRSGRGAPMVALAHFARRYLEGLFTAIHLLPFFPSSSDRGFSVMDFEQVDPAVGDWDQVAYLREAFRLMFDGVFNHVSSKSRWFREFMNRHPDYLDYFTAFTDRESMDEEHRRMLFRPRTTEVLTPVDTLDGTRHVWTTFGPDQVDLNFRNPRVLARIIEILLFYVRHGADIVRLDAVTYLWDEAGTTGAHLNETHMIIRLFRDILDAVAPHVALITETNVPHGDNISYFGNGTDEAQMVYNFALPPLVLHTFQKEDASRLSMWADSLEHISDRATYFNFLDSHDGIGVMAARGILSREEITAMAARVLEHGGYISYRPEADGTVSPYELNITWWSALNRDVADEGDDLRIARYLASRSIALALIGVPGVYLHGLIGTENNGRAVMEERDRRAINRATLEKTDFYRGLDDPATRASRVFTGMARMLRIRAGEGCFHPNAPQKVIFAGSNFFTLLRRDRKGNGCLLAVVNVSSAERSFDHDMAAEGAGVDAWTDLLSGSSFRAEGGMLSLVLEPYGIRWLASG